MNTVYTDMSGDAGWRRTYLCSNPWVVAPAYTLLIGFCLSMVMGDLLHAWNLGTGRDVAGCVLRIVLNETHIFQGTLDQRFAEATLSLKAYARRFGYSLRMKKLTRSKIHWGTKQHPELAASGSDTNVVLQWLEHLLTPYANIYGGILTLLYASNRAIKLLYDAGMFLTEAEKNTVRVLGHLFCQHYAELAWGAVNNLELLWRCRPKLHVVAEMLLLRRNVNPKLYATWMDEDFLKKTAKTLRLTSNKTAQIRFLQRWLMGIPEQLRLVREGR